MNSTNQYDAGAAMVGLSCFISPDLARDLANDIMNMVRLGDILNMFILQYGIMISFKIV